VVSEFQSARNFFNFRNRIMAAIVCFFSVTAEAAPPQELVLEPRTLAMGGASVALADDEYALFSNAAGLAGQTKRQFKIANLTLESTGDAISELSTATSTFKNFQASDLNQLMGKDIAVRANYVPMLTLPNFAIAYVVDAQGALDQFNRANPYYQLTDMVTHGVQAGFGWDIQQGKRATDEFKFGVAGKLLWRRGGTYTVTTAGLLQATAGGNSGQSYLNNLLGGYGEGVGADVGFQYIHKLDKTSKFYFGSSITDITNTTFSDPNAAPLNRSVNFGVGYKKEFQFMKLAIDFDLKHLEDQIAFTSKTHLGVDMTFSILDIYLGANQLDPTYGIGFDLWVLKMTAISYAEENSIYFGENTSRKYLLQAEFNLPI
jgi:hypothetical protein